MDDISFLRELESDVPSLTEPARRVAHERLAAEFRAEAAAGSPTVTGATVPVGRMRGAARRRRSLRARLSWQSVTMAASAAAVAGIVAVGLVANGEPATPRATPSQVRPVSAVQLLEQAARVVERRPQVRPTPHQWVYSKEIRTDASPPQTSEHWIRFDGRLQASMERNLEVMGAIGPEDDDKTPQQIYDFFRALPADPDSVLARIDRWSRGYAGVDRNDRLFRAIGSLLHEDVIAPPAAQAALYRATARIPGVSVKEGVLDAAGRVGVAVIREADGVRQEVILAPGNYRYLGLRAITVQDEHHCGRPDTARKQPRPAPGTTNCPRPELVRKASETLINTARLASGIVGNPGQRP